MQFVVDCNIIFSIFASTDSFQKGILMYKASTLSLEMVECHLCIYALSILFYRSI